MAIVQAKEYTRIKKALNRRINGVKSTSLLSASEKSKITSKLISIRSKLVDLQSYGKKTGQTNKSTIKVPSYVAKAFKQAKGTSLYTEVSLAVAQRAIPKSARGQEILDNSLRTQLRGARGSQNAKVLQLVKNKLTALRKVRGTGSGTDSNAKGFIYKITDTKSGKVYVGQTVKTPQTRFNEHLAPNSTRAAFDRIAKRIGKGNLKLTVLKTTTRRNLDRLEAQYIKKFNATNKKFGFNTRQGNIASINGIRKYTPAKVTIIKRKS